MERECFRTDRKTQPNILQILELQSGAIETVPESEGKFNQRWSPDGKWIAATPNDCRGLGIFSLERREWTILTGMRADYPSWSHNSDYLYFWTALDSGEEAIYRVSLASRKTERVASLAGARRAVDEVYGRWTGLAPDDSPLILRSTEFRQIFLLTLGRN
jgi:Tol biopolymer transport system component